MRRSQRWHKHRGIFGLHSGHECLLGRVLPVWNNKLLLNNYDFYHNFPTESANGSPEHKRGPKNAHWNWEGACQNGQHKLRETVKQSTNQNPSTHECSNEAGQTSENTVILFPCPRVEQFRRAELTGILGSGPGAVGEKILIKIFFINLFTDFCCLRKLFLNNK